MKILTIFIFKYVYLNLKFKKISCAETLRQQYCVHSRTEYDHDGINKNRANKIYERKMTR